jgi:hypothetical protein
MSNANELIEKIMVDISELKILGIYDYCDIQKILTKHITPAVPTEPSINIACECWNVYKFMAEIWHFELNINWPLMLKCECWKEFDIFEIAKSTLPSNPVQVKDEVENDFMCSVCKRPLKINWCCTRHR